MLQSKSQEHGEWKISMGLIKLFASPGKKKASELFTLFKLILMLSLISYQQGEKYFWKYVTAVCDEGQVSV